MLCWSSSCEHQNTASAEFCASCGAPMALHGHYSALEVLGEGGFGKVFLAQDSNGALFAVKRSTLDHQELRKEAGILNVLVDKSDKVVKVEEFFLEGVDAFLVMSLVSGHPLEDLIYDEPFSPRKAMALLLDMLSVLEVLEGEFIIHGDIKPGNIIESDDGTSYTLIDFGSAIRFKGDDVRYRVSYTDNYAPPEQVNGMPMPWSDIYALGATVVESLIGETPSAIRRDYNCPELEIPIELGDAGISESLSKILMKMIAEDEGDRYHSIREIRVDLASVNQSKRPRKRREVLAWTAC